MAITAAQVKQLREVTGAGMMDCKKALTQTNGDMDAAIEFLRKKGQAKAEKKASRIAAEGICLIAQNKLRDRFRCTEREVPHLRCKGRTAGSEQRR